MRNSIQMQLIEKDHIYDVKNTKGKAAYPRDRHLLVIAYFLLLTFLVIVANMAAWILATPVRKAEIKASLSSSHVYDCREGYEHIDGRLALNPSSHPIECIEKEKVDN